MEQFVATAALFAVGLLAPTVEGGCSVQTCSKGTNTVCAHNPTMHYKEFSDKCAVDKANNCGEGGWTVIHPGPCTPAEIRGCLPLCEPVCGKSTIHGYKSFLSKCYLDIFPDYKFIHHGACTPLEVPPSTCPGTECSLKIEAYVCGYSPFTGYLSFSTHCHLNLYNLCYYGTFSVKHTGECTTNELETNCQRKPCTKEYNPVCGRSTDMGYKTFPNTCTFYYENTCPKFGYDYKIAHPGACTSQEIASFCKPGFCPDYYKPVCAYSGQFYRNFLNICYLYVANNCKKGGTVADYQLVHNGECSIKEQEQSCSVKCPKDEVPVCGFSHHRGYQSFPNKCTIEYENACHGTDYSLVHIGQCKKGELELICGKEYCLQYKGKNVCGLSPNKGYANFDNQCALYSENTCKYGDYKFAHFGECTKAELGLICLPEFCHKPGTPVCGYNEKNKYFTFLSVCYLYKEKICKGIEYVEKHKGKCTDYELGGKCPVFCSKEYEYICAISPTYGFKTILNKCNLDAENWCNGGDFKYYHAGECTKKELEKNCQLKCPYIYKPVCTSSPKKGLTTFSNICLFILDITCYGTDYKYKHGGICEGTPEPPPPPQCPTICPALYDPVCGYIKSTNEYRTFSNKCKFDVDKCKYKNDLIFAHSGACSKKELENDCSRKCPTEASPVCGVNHDYVYKNFLNTCTLLLGLSCYRSDFTLAHEGKCTVNEAPVCSAPCPKKLEPICVYSLSKKIFQNFDSKCEFEYENECKYGDYIIVHGGPCTEYELENYCERPCPKTLAPVCGYSPTKGFKTYPNKCIFVRALTCLGCDYVFFGEGKCKYPEGPQNDCPGICTYEIDPVCAFSSTTKMYQTFDNHCLLKAYNRCQYGDYVYVHPGKCKKEETGHQCYRYCPPTPFKPVCAYRKKDGYRTFSSICTYEVANKCDGADYTIKHEGPCTPKENGGFCKFNCPLYYIGICGVSHVDGHKIYKSFPSDCFRVRENICNFSDYKIAHTGRCTPQETGKNCTNTCQMVYSPVCGTSPKKGHKTFPNFCTLDHSNSCYYNDYNVKHPGECFGWELCKNCKH